MKSIVLVGCGVQQVEAVKIAKDAGYYVIVTDRSRSAPGAQYADEFVIIDGIDVQSLIAYVMLNKERLNIQGVFTLVNLTTTAALVSHACGLPGIHPRAAVAGQNKIVMKRLMMDHGIPTPAFREVGSYDEAVEAFDALGGTVFVKPPDNFGGQGTRKVVSLQELRGAFEDAIDHTAYRDILVEQFVEGSYHDVNAIHYGGKCHPVGMVDSFFIDEYPPGCQISPIEHFVRCPSLLPEDTQRELYDLLDRATRALGIDFGPVGGDAILTDDGPMFIEVAPRLHGASGTLWMVPYSTGTKPVQAVVEVMAGRPLNKDLITPKLKRVCMNRLPLVPPGKIVRIAGVEEARSLDGILQIYIFRKEGDIIESYENSTMVPCSIIAVGDSEGDVRAVMEKALSLIVIETDDVT